MSAPTYSLAYPRRRWQRAFLRALGRLVLPLAFKVRLIGEEHCPPSGPLLVVGNHTAALEAIMMAVFTPWQVELMGAGDIPLDKVSAFVGAIFGFIPVRRGAVDRPAMNAALDILKQRGVLGMFPEGGIWETSGARKAHTGVAWLSYRGRSPVLPIWFGGMEGAIGAALRLKRPALTMTVGPLIPAATPAPGVALKDYLEDYAGQVMTAVNSLQSAEERARPPKIRDERFEFSLTVQTRAGQPVALPPELVFPEAEGQALAKLLHRPALMRVFSGNLGLPTSALQRLDREHNAQTLADATQVVVNYLKTDNPYFLSYRFPSQYPAMQAGVERLLAVARWAAARGYRLHVQPVRRYYSTEQGREIVQVKQGEHRGWM